MCRALRSVCTVHLELVEKLLKGVVGGRELRKLRRSATQRARLTSGNNGVDTRLAKRVSTRRLARPPERLQAHRASELGESTLGVYNVGEDGPRRCLAALQPVRLAADRRAALRTARRLHRPAALPDGIHVPVGTRVPVAAVRSRRVARWWRGGWRRAKRRV